MKKIQFILLTFLLVASTLICAGQKHHFEIKYIGFGWHPSDEGLNADKMPLKFDSEGKFMFNIGFIGGYERFFNQDRKFIKRFSIEAMAALYLDCALAPDGIAHIGFRGVIIDRKKHSLNGGLGPTILFRKSWYRHIGSEYVPSGYFNGGKDDFFQWRFYWYGGELEYNYKFDEYNFLSVSIIPGFPKYVALFFGYERKLGAKKSRLANEETNPVVE